jgi:hypothetical protein
MPPADPIGLSSYLVVSDAAAAIEFYKQAFGAKEIARHTAPNGSKIMHARDSTGMRCEVNAIAGVYRTRRADSAAKGAQAHRIAQLLGLRPWLPRGRPRKGVDGRMLTTFPVGQGLKRCTSSLNRLSAPNGRALSRFPSSPIQFN